MRELFDNNGTYLLHISNSNTIILRIFGFNPLYLCSLSPIYCNKIADGIKSEDLSVECTGTKADIIIKFAYIIKEDINDKFNGPTANKILNYLYRELYSINYYVDRDNDNYKPRKYSFGFLHKNRQYTLEFLIDVNSIEVIITEI